MMKLIKEALDERKCKEFEMTLQDKSKLCVGKELKQGVGFGGIFEMCTLFWVVFVKVPTKF